MADDPFSVFRSYEHNLLESDNARFLSRVFHQVMKLVPITQNEDLMEMGEGIRKQIAMINHGYVWYCVSKSVLGIEDEELPNQISTVNNRRVEEFANAITAGILIGFEQLQPIMNKHRSSPLREAALAAIGVYPHAAEHYEEIAGRVATVLGTVENAGTVGTALTSIGDGLLEGQSIFVDMLRVYGNDCAKWYSL